MKQLLLLLLLAASGGYSQNFSVTQIDSIAQKEGAYFNSDGNINVKEDDKQIAVGGFSYSYNLYMLYYDEWKKLSPAEKKTTDYKKGSQLIKGIYHKVLHYEKEDYSIETTVELYYRNEELFAAKITKRKSNDDGQLSYGISLHPVKNDTFDASVKPEIKELIQESNRQILKYYKD